MSEPIRYIHIGFPKCASTALQKFFFSKHPELYHLGANAGGTAAPYLSGEIQTIIELSLRLQRDAAYNSKWIKSVFEEQFSMAREQGMPAVGISSESLSIMLTQDVDTVHKANRLLDIFGQQTKIIFVFREQWSFIASIYRELVRGGLHLTYQAFVDNLYYNQAYSFMMDLDYYNTYAMYSALFGPENVLLLPYESLKEDAGVFLTHIQRHLQITPLITQLPYANKRADDVHMETVRQLNCVHRINWSRAQFEPFIAYRFPHYFEEQLGLPVPASSVADQEFIHSISSRRDNRLAPYATQPLSYEAEGPICERLTQQFRAWNRQLMEQTQIDLTRWNYLV